MVLKKGHAYYLYSGHSPKPVQLPSLL